MVQRMVIVADHRLFQAEVVEQPQRDAGILSRHEIGQAEGGRHPRGHIVEVADRRRNQVQCSGHRESLSLLK